RAAAPPRAPALARAGFAAALLAACTPHADDAPPCDPTISAADDDALVGKIAAPRPRQPAIEPPPVMGEAPPANFVPPPPPPPPEVVTPLMGALAEPQPPPPPPPDPTLQGE